jgi:hypothetical protein
MYIINMAFPIVVPTNPGQGDMILKAFFCIMQGRFCVNLNPSGSVVLKRFLKTFLIETNVKMVALVAAPSNPQGP